MEHLPNIYQEFITNSLYKAELSNKDIDTLFNLHNNFVNPHKPEYSKGCVACVKRAWDAVKSHFPIINSEPSLDGDIEIEDLS
jgi:hypothetical protein